MATEASDSTQIQVITKTITEMKAALAALKNTVSDLITRACTTEDERKEMDGYFNETYLNHLNTIRGVDVSTNLSIGRVILTKYNKSKTAERWEMNADIKSTS